MRSIKVVLSISAFFAPLLLGSSIVSAQTFGAASIHGRVIDESGAPVPGATVIGRSPALQLPQVMTVSDGGGEYELKSLRPGTYSLRFELSGFQTVVRDAIELSAGFDAKIDVTLTVGTLSETLTVSGASPIIDVTSTAMSSTLSREELDVIPTSKSLAEAIAMAPGVRYSGAIDVGGNRTAAFGDGGTNFGSVQQSPFLEGINLRLFEGGSEAYLDQRSLQEIQVKAVGNDAEVGPPGIAWNGVVKSGGNEFHGFASAEGQSATFQSGNVDAALRAQGVNPAGNGIKGYGDLSGSFGGRLIRDKLWFYTAERWIRRESNIIGFSASPGPDGKYGTADDVPGAGKIDNTGQTFKLSYQASKNYRAIGFYQRSLKHEFTRNGGPFFPLESTWDYWYNPHPYKLEFEGTPSAHLLFNALWGRSPYFAQWRPQANLPGTPVTQDIATLIQTGSALTAYNPNINSLFTSSASYFPQKSLGGRHEIKVGFQWQHQLYGAGNPDMSNGNYILIFDNGAPFEVATMNRPVDATAQMNNSAGFVRDTWRVGRLTANLGLRYERYRAYTDDSTKVQGTFGNAGFFPGFEVLSWQSFAPRLGAAWDVTGTGNSVLKAQWGRFNHESSASFALGYAADVLNTTTYRWHDLNGNKQYDPGEVNLDPNGPDFVSIASASGATTALPNPVVNKALTQPFTDESSVAWEQVLQQNLSLRTLFVYKTVSGLYDQVNALRPLSAWTNAIPRIDPGPDGVQGTADDGGTVTIYDFTPNYRGSSFVGTEYVNRDAGHQDVYKGFEVTLTKRSSGRWSAQGSFQVFKNHRWIKGVPSSPNDLYFPLDETLDWSGKALGSYHAPADIQISALLNVLAGTPTSRTYTFRGIPDAGTVTIPLEPFGASRTPAQKVVNLRLARPFRMANNTLTVSAQIYNLLNDNAATTVSYQSGPTFGAISVITPPRIARFGVEFLF
jgi:outer membrane receptor protein involved in Fe transport